MQMSDSKSKNDLTPPLLDNNLKEIKVSLTKKTKTLNMVRF